jgi:hypothetical protein
MGTRRRGPCGGRYELRRIERALADPVGVKAHASADPGEKAGDRATIADLGAAPLSGRSSRVAVPPDARSRVAACPSGGSRVAAPLATDLGDYEHD